METRLPSFNLEVWNIKRKKDDLRKCQSQILTEEESFPRSGCRWVEHFRTLPRVRLGKLLHGELALRSKEPRVYPYIANRPQRSGLFTNEVICRSVKPQ